MKEKIIIYMVVRNVSQKEKLITKVVSQASKVSKDFFVVSHGSDDNTIEILKELENSLKLNLELVNEDFIGTMDDMKGKYYKVLKNKYGKVGKYILLLDWDEVLDDKLIFNINNLDFSDLVYMLNINTYLITKVIDINHYQPRLFDIDSVEINSFSKFHNLFKIKTKKVRKIKGVIHHYSYGSINDLLRKNIFYAKGEAEDLFYKNKKINNFSIFIRFVIEGTIYFLYTLFYHLNFLTLEGWMYSINWYVYKFYKYLFYIELKNENIRAS